MSKLYDLLSAMCGKIKKPDWNQNDIAAPDYVKNRTHYEKDAVETTIIPKTTASGKLNMGVYMYGTEYVDISVGESYNVIFDGILYTCIAYYSEAFHHNAIGSDAIIGGNGGNNEPFLIGVSLKYPEDGTLVIFNDASEHTFSVSCKIKEVVKIPAKYLPDDAINEIVYKAISKKVPPILDVEISKDSEGFTFSETFEDVLNATRDGIVFGHMAGRTYNVSQNYFNSEFVVTFYRFGQEDNYQNGSPAISVITWKSDGTATEEYYTLI